MRSSWRICLIVPALLGAGSTVASSQEAVVTHMGYTLEDVGAYLENLSPTASCVFGHLETPTRSTMLVGLDHTHFAFKARPHVDCDHCSVGFRVHTIHMLTEVREMPFPEPLILAGLVDLMNVQFPVGNCVGPEPHYRYSDCSSFYAVSIVEPGFYDIGVPIDCSCAFNSYPYLIGFENAWWPYGLVDAECLSCSGWGFNTYDTRWRELCDYLSLPGDVLYYVEAECCSPPVGDRTSSWSSLKALFDR